jgi:membrane-anchored mycosin MYCP
VLAPDLEVSALSWRFRALQAAVALGVAAAGGVVAPPAMATARPPAKAAAGVDNCAAAGEQIRAVSWPQEMLGLQRVWQFSRGGGVTVAVLDSGVDAGHPQLAGRVEPGFDALAGSGRADNDCLGTGTQVAGVIAARQVTSVGFAGVAPSVRILPIRVIGDQRSGGAVADPDVLARGIKAALDLDADVIAVSTVTYTDTPALRAAVASAVDQGVNVVAAVGDRGDDSGGNPPPYPATYQAVTGVGAIERSGARWSKSQHGRYVDLVAPGAEVVTLQRAGGMTTADGTALACGFVAGVTALVRARRDIPASKIRQMLSATAVPAASPEEYGKGVVNPYAAVTDQVANSSASPLPALVRPSHEVPSAWERSRELAIAGTLVGVGAVVVVLLLAVALPKGRRRLWRSGLAAAPPQTGETDEPSPPVLLFDERT